MREFGRSGEEATWAVVTGGSDGIGLEMAKKLAREGFSVCIVSRNLEKMNEKMAEIMGQPGVDNTKQRSLCIQVDFSELLSVKDYTD